MNLFDVAGRFQLNGVVYELGDGAADADASGRRFCPSRRSYCVNLGPGVTFRGTGG